MNWVHRFDDRHAVAFRVTRVTRTTARCRFRVHCDQEPSQKIAQVSEDGTVRLNVIGVPVDRSALERIAAERFPGKRIELLWETPSVHRPLIEPMANLQDSFASSASEN